MLDICNVRVLSGCMELPGQYVRIEGGQITRTGPMREYRPVDAARVLDGRGAFLCPGFIDIHTHGAMGYDTMDATREALDAMARFQLSQGVTTFLPTTMTAPLADIGRALEVLRDYAPPLPVDMPGVHLEGPLLAKANRGAHPEKYLLAPDDSVLDFIRGFARHISLVTLAPELPGAAEFTSACRSMGIMVSGGHDAADETAVRACVAAGLGGVTHLYCCTSTVGRRGGWEKHAGLAEMALADDRLFVEIIADGYHVPQELLRLVYKVKGPRRIVLVSDSIRATGLVPGRYDLGGGDAAVAVDVREGIALLEDGSGFAGSVCPLGSMVERLAGWGLPLAHAAHMASGAPAEYLGFAGKGSVAPGYEAKLNLLQPGGALLGTILSEEHTQLTDIGRTWYEDL